MCGENSSETPNSNSSNEQFSDNFDEPGKLQNLCYYDMEELEELKQYLIEAIAILGPGGCVPKEYTDLLEAIDAEIFERTVLG